MAPCSSRGLCQSLGLTALFPHAVPVPEPPGQTGVVTVISLPLISGTHTHTCTLAVSDSPSRSPFLSQPSPVSQERCPQLALAFLELAPHSHFPSRGPLFFTRLAGLQRPRQPCMKLHTPSPPATVLVLPYREARRPRPVPDPARPTRAPAQARASFWSLGPPRSPSSACQTVREVPSLPPGPVQDVTRTSRLSYSAFPRTRSHGAFLAHRRRFRHRHGVVCASGCRSLAHTASPAYTRDRSFAHSVSSPHTRSPARGLPAASNTHRPALSHNGAFHTLAALRLQSCLSQSGPMAWGGGRKVSGLQHHL